MVVVPPYVNIRLVYLWIGSDYNVQFYLSSVYLMCMGTVRLHVCLCATRMSGTCGGWKRASHALELELQTESFHVDAGTQIGVPWRSSQCSQLLCRLSSSSRFYFKKGLFDLLAFVFSVLSHH